MEPTRSLRRLLAVAATAVLTGVAVATPSSASDVAKPTYCTVAVVSVDESGLGTLGPVTCASSPAKLAAAAGPTAMMSYTIATHYAGWNFTGSALTVTGTGCSGLYINMPAAWVDVVSSTRSYCTVAHYDYFYLGGPVLYLGSPGGNLSGFDNMTNSAQYL